MAKPIMTKDMKSRSAASLRQDDVTAVVDGKEVSFSGNNAEKYSLAFITKLQQLLVSGMPLGDAVKALNARVKEPHMRYISGGIWKELSEGASLAAAMARMPKVFEPTIVHMVEAGEATGNLKPILHNLTELLENRIAMRKRILSSLAYPFFIVFVAFGVLAFFLFYLLPRIQGMMDSMGGQMTLPARMLIGFSELSFTYGPILLGVLAIAAVGVYQWRRNPEGRYVTDRWLLRIPILGQVFRNAEVCRMTNMLAVLLGSGVTATESMRLVEKTLVNSDFQSRFRTARTLVNDGSSFSNAFVRCELLEDMDMDILSISENTGNITDGLLSIYKQRNEEITEKTQLLTAIVATGALLFVFSLVALIVLGIVTSILQLSQTVLGG